MQLFQGDCLEIMKLIPEHSIDMILCDLPYGTTSNAWDKKIDLEKLFTEYKRVIKSGGAIALFSQPPFNAELIQANRKQFRYEWIWTKAQGTGFLNANKMPLKMHENILIFYDKLPVYHPQKTFGHENYCKSKTKSSSTNYRKLNDTLFAAVTDGSRYPADVLYFPQVNCSKEPKLHPTQKPVPLLEYLIKTYTNEGETILDNCMGAGSTGVACLNTGREFIGIELDKNYFEIAEKRLKSVTQ